MRPRISAPTGSWCRSAAGRCGCGMSIAPLRPILDDPGAERVRGAVVWRCCSPAMLLMQAAPPPPEEMAPPIVPPGEDAAAAIGEEDISPVDPEIIEGRERPGLTTAPLPERIEQQRTKAQSVPRRQKLSDGPTADPRSLAVDREPRLVQERPARSPITRTPTRVTGRSTRTRCPWLPITATTGFSDCQT